MRAGVIEQIGSPREIYRHPVNHFVADFIGETNFLEGRINNGILETDSGRISLKGLPDGEIMIAVRPECVKISRNLDGLQGKIVKSTYLGEVEQYQIQLQGEDSPSWRVALYNPRERFLANTTVSLHFDVNDVILI